MIGNTKHDTLNAAYLMYYATDVALEDGVTDARLKRGLEELISDALTIAHQSKFDVFNALTLMDNDLFISDLKVRSTALVFSYT